MRLNWKQILGGLALFAMALPVWAHTDSIHYVATQPTTIEGHKLAPGTYDLKASDTTNQVEIQQNGATVTKVPCKWIQLPKKAQNSEVLTNNSRITQLQFSGKTEAATFAR